MQDYRLLAIWRIAAPLAQVFDAVLDSLAWPAWWPGADRVEQLEPGDVNGIGSVRHYTWKGSLPYRLSFRARATRIDTLRFLEAEVDGDLRGSGRWAFSHEAGITTVRYEWCVCTTKPWMNLVAPLTRRVFERNHHALMHQGAEALACRLGARLVDAHYGELPSQPQKNGAPPNWPAGAFAGLVAGAVATVVQVGLWWSASLPAIGMLLRDARLAAAIVLGREVLPPPVAFDWSIMLVATLVHLVLSAVYGLALAPLVAGSRTGVAAVAGLLFGFALFATNMYLFTALFPWFEASRDWITAAAHGAFGLSGAVVYKWMERERAAGARVARKPWCG